MTKAPPKIPPPPIPKGVGLGPARDWPTAASTAAGAELAQMDILHRARIDVVKRYRRDPKSLPNGPDGRAWGTEAWYVPEHWTESGLYIAPHPPPWAPHIQPSVPRRKPGQPQPGDGVSLRSMEHPPGLIKKVADAVKSGKLDPTVTPTVTPVTETVTETVTERNVTQAAVTAVTEHMDAATGALTNAERQQRYRERLKAAKEALAKATSRPEAKK